MQERIIISVGKDWDGFTFRLRPKSKQWLMGAGYKTKGMGSTKRSSLTPAPLPEYRERGFEPLMSQVSISFDEKKKIEELGGPIYKYIVEMLTGMTLENLNKLGGVIFADAETEKVIHDTKKGEGGAHA